MCLWVTIRDHPSWALQSGAKLVGAISSRIYQSCPCCWVVLVSMCQEKAFIRLCLWFCCCYQLKLAFILKYLVSRWSN